MINIVSHFLLFLFLIFYNGKFITDFLKNNEYRFNFFEIAFFGIIFTSLVAQSLNFFFPLNDNVIYINLIFILIFIYFNKKTALSIKIKKIDMTYVMFFILIILNIYGSQFSDDLDHYHYKYINNTDNTNYIIGLSHLHWAFGNSSIWLISHSYFNFDYSRLQDIHVLNGLFFFLILGALYFNFKNAIIKKKNSVFAPILLFLIIFILIKYTRLKEFGLDRPAFLALYFFISFYIKNFLINTQPKMISENILLLTYISIFIFYIKINFFFIGLIPLYYIVKYNKFNLLLSLSFLPIYFFIFSYLLKNILISGCLIYPLPISCFDFVSWSAKEIAEKWYFLNEVLNKSWYQYNGNLEDIDYVKNFNWIETWFNKSKIELIEFTVTTLFSLSLVLFSFKKSSLNKNPVYNFRSKEILNIFVFLTIITFCFFIFKLPVIRMSHYLFIFFSIITIIFLFQKFHLNSRTNFITIILLLCIVFNISKNLLRINKNGFINNPYLMVNSKVYNQTEKSLGSFKYYLGWYGKAPSGNTNLDGFKHKKILIFNTIYK